MIEARCESFPKESRLLKSYQFRWVLRKGLRFYAPNFTVVYKKTSSPSRLGLTVSRKVGNSVERNRVKRFVRECFRCNKPPESAHRSIVVIARNGAANLSYEQVCSELRPFFLNTRRAETRRKGSKRSQPMVSGRA